ncbi:MAG: hypothetical protein Q9172_006242 [Xanthocarpia lactea]
MPTVHILTLPNEILRVIFSFLTTRPLLNASLACRHFCLFAQPVLFRNIRLWLKPRIESNHKYIRSNPGTIHRFWDVVSTLRKNPTLRQNVEVLSLEIWCEGFGDHNTLLNILPRLKALHLSPTPAKLDLSRHLSIETLELDFDDFDYRRAHLDDDRSTLDSLSKHLHYPSLRSLKASWPGLMEPHGRRYFPADRYCTSPITSLSLKVGDGETVGALPELLRTFRALQNFTFETSCSWEGEHMIEHEMSPLGLGRCVSYHAATLVELVIACSNGASFPRSTLFGTLTHFSSLKRLGILETFLAKHEDRSFDHLLPPNLESLQLQYAMGSNQGHDEERTMRIKRMSCLLKNKDLNVPRLRRLIWWDQQTECWSHMTYGPLSAMFELRHAARCVGVRFQYKNASYFKDSPLAVQEDPVDLGVEHGYLGGDLSPEDFCVLEEEYDDARWLDGHLGM